MTGLDYTVLLAYMAGLFVIGGVFSSKIRDSRDMFLAGGESPWWVSGLSNFMTMFSAGTFVVWGGIAYKHGLVAISICLCNGVAAILIGFWVAGQWKKTGVTTGAEFIELRFGKAALHFYTWTGIVFKLLVCGVALYSIAVLLSALVPMPEGYPFRDPSTGHFSVYWAVVLFGGIVIVYTVVGGLWAVLMTDVLQFIVLTLAVSVVVPLVLSHELVGGFTGFVSKAPAGFFLPVSDEFTLFFLAGWTALQFFSIGGEWGFAQRFLCVSSDKDARKSAWLFGVLYLVSPFIWMLPPMVYRIFNPGADPKEAYILACREVLPPGTIGLMLAAMFSATASMIDSQLNVFAGVLTRDFFRPLFRPDSTEHTLVFVGRIITLALGLILIGISLAVPSLGGVENLVLSIGTLLITPLMAPTVWGLLSRRIDARAVWVTAVTGFAAGALVRFGFTEGGFLTGIGSLGAMSVWIQSHYRVMEIAAGVVLPVVVLTILEWRGPAVSAGWLRVSDRQRSWETGSRTVSSSLPARMVAWNVGVLGLLMLGLAMIQKEERATILVFALALFAIAGCIGLYLWKKE